MNIDKNSATWMTVRGWALSRLEIDREKIESAMCALEEVPGLRARIALLKDLLAMEKNNE